MVPCFVCGKDATGGFIHGYAPEPDGKKVGLCLQHNSTENKKKAILYWIRQQKSDVLRINEINALRMGTAPEQTVTIHFIDGGVANVQCLSWQLVDGALQLLKPDKSLTFVPLQHIRTFDLHGIKKG